MATDYFRVLTRIEDTRQKVAHPRKRRKPSVVRAKPVAKRFRPVPVTVLPRKRRRRT